MAAPANGVKSSTGVTHYPFGRGGLHCGSCGLRWPCHYIADRIPSPTTSAPIDYGYSTKPRSYWPDRTAT